MEMLIYMAHFFKQRVGFQNMRDILELFIFKCKGAEKRSKDLQAQVYSEGYKKK